MPKQTNKKAFLLLMVALFSGIVGFGAIKLVRIFIIAREQLSEQDVSENQGESVPAEKSNLEVGFSSYKGIISSTHSTPPQLTHVLLDENGEEVIYLMADDHKLKISESMEVEVQGRVSSLKDVDKPVMTVERVVFK
jgi:hypothetical protein